MHGVPSNIKRGRTALIFLRLCIVIYSCHSIVIIPPLSCRPSSDSRYHASVVVTIYRRHTGFAVQLLSRHCHHTLVAIPLSQCHWHAIVIVLTSTFDSSSLQYRHLIVVMPASSCPLHRSIDDIRCASFYVNRDTVTS